MQTPIKRSGTSPRIPFQTPPFHTADRLIQTLRIKCAIQTIRIRQHRDLNAGHLVLIGSLRPGQSLNPEPKPTPWKAQLKSSHHGFIRTSSIFQACGGLHDPFPVSRSMCRGTGVLLSNPKPHTPHPQS